MCAHPPVTKQWESSLKPTLNPFKLSPGNFDGEATYCSVNVLVRVVENSG